VQSAARIPRDFFMPAGNACAICHLFVSWLEGGLRRSGAALSSYLQLALQGKQKIANVIAASAGARADRHGHPNALRDKRKCFMGPPPHASSALPRKRTK